MANIEKQIREQHKRDLEQLAHIREVHEQAVHETVRLYDTARREATTSPDLFQPLRAIAGHGGSALKDSAERSALRPVPKKKPDTLDAFFEWLKG